MILTYILYILVFIAAFAVGYGVRHVVSLYKKGNIEKEIEERLYKARKESHEIEEKAISQATKRREEIEKREERINLIERRLENKEEEIHDKEKSLDQEKKEVRQNTQMLEDKKASLEKEKESIANLTEEDAREYIFARIEREQGEDIWNRSIKLAREGEAILKKKAEDIMVNTMYRIANNDVASFTTSTVIIENEEIKGKIIGKEGRNIKTFERVAGVDVLVDEVPNGIVISCFDPVRRAIAVNALTSLIEDGRIQPVKIEETLEKAKKDIGIFMKKKGEEAVYECRLIGVPDSLIPLIGRLYFRTSYGQNVLNHSIEMAHIAGMLAEEVGADPYIARAGALLHDIGKAVDSDIEGTHVEIGRKILKKYAMDERIIKAMQSHHEEYPYETVESVLVQVADAISGGRPGARRDTAERYIERLEQLEALAMAFQGAEKVYALQAGREIRVFVTPSLVSDIEAREMARDIAIRIEKELRYPGEIKVHVIRESRSIEIAR